MRSGLLHGLRARRRAQTLAWYARPFARFDTRGGRFRASWNWVVFLSALVLPVWYAAHGMWGRFVVYSAVGIFASVSGLSPLWATLLAVTANWELYRHVGGRARAHARERV